MSHAFFIKELVKRYPPFQLGPIDLELPEGSVLGLVGPNGAGKSTLVHLLSGLLRPDVGIVQVLGKEVGAFDGSTRARIGLVREEAALPEYVTVDYLLQSTASFYSRWNQGRMNALLERFTIDTGRKVRELSKGTRLKVQIVLALSHDADLLLLDEPFAGLDLIARRHLRELLGELRAAREVSIVLSSHNIEEIERLCDRVALLSAGSLLLSGTPEEIVASWQRLECSAEAAEALSEHLKVDVFRRHGKNVYICERDGSRLSAWLAAHATHEVVAGVPTLEEICDALLTRD